MYYQIKQNHWLWRALSPLLQEYSLCQLTIAQGGAGGLSHRCIQGGETAYCMPMKCINGALFMTVQSQTLPCPTGTFVTVGAILFSAFVVANTPIRFPLKKIIHVTQHCIHRRKASWQYLVWFWERNHWSLRVFMNASSATIPSLQKLQNIL